MDELSHQVGLGPELAGGGHLDYEHQQSVGPHDKEEHLEGLLQGEEGVESVGGRGGHISVAPPVQLAPPYALIQSSQLDCVISWRFFFPIYNYFRTPVKTGEVIICRE